RENNSQSVAALLILIHRAPIWMQTHQPGLRMCKRFSRGLPEHAGRFVNMHWTGEFELARAYNLTRNLVADAREIEPSLHLLQLLCISSQHIDHRRAE